MPTRRYETTCQDCHGCADTEEPCTRCDNRGRLLVTECPALAGAHDRDASAATDPERIAFLENMGAHVEWVALDAQAYGGAEWAVINRVGHVRHTLGTGPTWRAAVDAAMEAAA